MIDDYNRESIRMEADFSLLAERVIRELEQMISWPESLRLFVVTMVPNTTALPFKPGLQNGESGLNIFNQATHSKMLMLKDLTGLFATSGCHNITG